MQCNETHFRVRRIAMSDMSEMNREPNERPALEELDGSLRRAVEQIRNEPAPQEPMTRALDRVSGLNARLPMPVHRASGGDFYCRGTGSFGEPGE
jgi:hypothetical protein